MKAVLILCVLALTGGLYYFAFDTVQSSEVAMTDASTESSSLIDRSEALVQEVANLSATNAEQQTALNQLTSERDALTAERDQVMQTLADKDALIAEMEAAEPSQDADETIAALNQELQSVRASLESVEAEKTALDEQLQAQQTELAAAQEQLAQASETAGGQSEEASALAAQIGQYEDQIATLEQQTADLTTQVATRDAALTQLRTVLESTNIEAISACQESTEALFADQSVGFAEGTPVLADASMPLLEQFATLAIDCINNGLNLTIEGHTDNLGGQASSLLLSNGRAMAVYDVLETAGVDAGNMRAVGFGPSDTPSNEQSISFIWR